MIDYELGADGIAVIAWNMADRAMNVLNDESVAAFAATVEAAIKDAAVKGVIITSKKRDFLAGADLTRLGRDVDAAGLTAFTMRFHALLRGMEKSGKPFCAALNGTALGGGYEIALACHRRIAADDPRIQIGLPEVTIGLLPGGGGTQRLPRLIGKSRAIDLMTTGRTLSPKEALEWGIVNRVFPKEKFMEETLGFAQSLAYPNHAARAVGLIKRSVVEGVEVPLHEGLALERELQNRLFSMADAKEGFKAFLEKRKPRFQGK